MEDTNVRIEYDSQIVDGVRTTTSNNLNYLKMLKVRDQFTNFMKTTGQRKGTLDLVIKSINKI